MNPADIRRLLGGYAADTLTAEERRALFEAALTDQDLFNELACEQALKELLEDPGARRQLLTALEEKPGFVERFRAWIGRPVAWVAAGSLAVAALLVVVLVRRAEVPLAPEPVVTAKLEVPSLPAAPPASARRAEPEVPSETAAGKAMRADAVVQPPNSIEVQPLGVAGGIVGAPTGRVRAPAGRGGGGGSAAPPPKPEMAQAEPVVRDQIAADSTTPAIAGSRTEARQALSMSASAVSGAAADTPSKAAVVPLPVPYKMLRAGADGKFAEAPVGAVFRAAERVRAVFSPPGPGRLVVTAANRSKPLLDRAARQGATVNLDVPAGVSALQVTFTAQPAAAPAPVTFSIAIPRQPAR